MRRRTSARFFPKKGCSIRLDVGEWAVALNICEALGSLKGNLSSKPVGWATGLPTTICLMGLVGNCWGDDFQAAFDDDLRQPETFAKPTPVLADILINQRSQFNYAI